MPRSLVEIPEGGRVERLPRQGVVQGREREFHHKSLVPQTVSHGASLIPSEE